MNVPMMGRFLAVCAPPTEDQTAAPPSSVMNSRRLMSNMGLLPACAIPAMIPANDCAPSPARQALVRYFERRGFPRVPEPGFGEAAISKTAMVRPQFARPAASSLTKHNRPPGSAGSAPPVLLPHHSCSESEMRTSEPKPHEINKLLVSFDSEVRKRGRGTMMRTSESGH